MAYDFSVRVSINPGTKKPYDSIAEGDTEASVIDLAKKRVKLQSGVIIDVTERKILDNGDYPIGHTDDAQVGIFPVYSTADTNKRTSLRIGHVSGAYALTGSPGKINAGHADITAWLASYNTNYATDWVFVTGAAHYGKLA